MLHTLHFFSFGLFFELPQMNASLFCLSFPFLQKADRTNLKVVTFRVFSEIIGNCVPFSFALPIWIENEVFIFTKDLLLFYPFVTKVTNSEDLEVIVNWSKFALVCCMCYGLRARDHGQSASKLLKQLQPWGLCTSSCFFSALRAVISPWTHVQGCVPSTLQTAIQYRIRIAKIARYLISIVKVIVNNCRVIVPLFLSVLLTVRKMCRSL